MKKIAILQYQVSKSDAKTLSNAMGQFDAYVTDNNENENKILNIISGRSTTYSEQQYKDAISFIHTLRERISAKIEPAKQEANKYTPEQRFSDGIIQNPQEFWNSKIDAYKAQLRYLLDIENILKKETLDEDEE